MPRSKWKVPYIKPNILKQFDKGTSIITKSRNSIILPIFLGKKIKVHSGNKFATLLISSEMIGHKFGEFAFTKRLGSMIHSKK